MRLLQADAAAEKGWLIGPLNSENELSIGYANRGIDEPHVHRLITEIYLIAKGQAAVRVGQETVSVRGGDVLQLDPGEAIRFYRAVMIISILSSMFRVCLVMRSGLIRGLSAGPSLD